MYIYIYIYCIATMETTPQGAPLKSGALLSEFRCMESMKAKSTAICRGKTMDLDIDKLLDLSIHGNTKSWAYKILGIPHPTNSWYFEILTGCYL